MRQLELAAVRTDRRTSLKERKFSPTLFRDPTHCPEEGIGGSAYWVTYHVQGNLGVAISTWDADAGVHWRAYADNRGFLADRLEDGTKVRKAYPNLNAAINALLEYHGIAPTYPHSKDRLF